MSTTCMSLAQALAAGRIGAAEAALDALIAAHLPARIGLQERLRDQADVAQALLMKACDATIASFTRSALKPSSPSDRKAPAAST